LQAAEILEFSEDVVQNSNLPVTVG
jgi:hypothetical protein